MVNINITFLLAFFMRLKNLYLIHEWGILAVTIMLMLMLASTIKF